MIKKKWRHFYHQKMFLTPKQIRAFRRQKVFYEGLLTYTHYNRVGLCSFHILMSGFHKPGEFSFYIKHSSSIFTKTTKNKLFPFKIRLESIL